MMTDKMRAYTLEIAFIILSLSISFLPITISRYVMALYLVLTLFIVKFFLKKDKKGSIYESKVCTFTFLASILYLAGLYGIGIFFGFERMNVFSWDSIFTFLIPLGIIHYNSEVIRNYFISQNGKIHDVLSFLGMLIIYFFIYRCYAMFTMMNGFMSEIGFGVFSSFACNWLYYFLSKHYGYKPVLIYSMITMLYPYVLPFVPRPSVFVHAIFNLFYPYLVYYIIEGTYSKDNGITVYRNRRRNAIQTGLVVLTSIMIVCLVSCKFKYGMLVIGSESMKTSLSKGDAIVFEKYNKQDIKKGDVIVFQQNEMSIVHRVVDIRKINGNVRYYTKGDANEEIDNFYATDDNIEGVMMFSIPFVGQPTLWLHNEF